MDIEKIIYDTRKDLDDKYFFKNFSKFAEIISNDYYNIDQQKLIEDNQYKNRQMLKDWKKQKENLNNNLYNEFICSFDFKKILYSA